VFSHVRNASPRGQRCLVRCLDHRRAPSHRYFRFVRVGDRFCRKRTRTTEYLARGLHNVIFVRNRVYCTCCRVRSHIARSSSVAQSLRGNDDLLSPLYCACVRETENGEFIPPPPPPRPNDPKRRSAREGQQCNGVRNSRDKGPILEITFSGRERAGENNNTCDTRVDAKTIILKTILRSVFNYCSTLAARARFKWSLLYTHIHARAYAILY